MTRGEPIVFTKKLWDSCKELTLALRFIAQKTKCASCASAHLNALNKVSQGKPITLEEQEALLCPQCAAALEAEKRKIA